MEDAIRDVYLSHWLNGGHSARFCTGQMQSQPEKNIGSAKNLKVCLFIRIYIFLFEPLLMKIDHLSTHLRVENDINLFDFSF